jgi:glycosyltransferase involved in cell wall biosynthesis
LRALTVGASAALMAEHRREPLDLIIPHEVELAARVARDLPGVPRLLTVHSPFVDENRLNNWKYTSELGRRLSYPATWAYAWRAERAGLRAVRFVHTLSEFTWSLLRARHPGPCRRILWRRVPGTFDDGRFRPPDDRQALRRRLGWSSDQRVMFTVRRLIPRNGVDRILTAAARLAAREDVAFVIGGRGPLFDPLRARVAREGLGSRVRLVGAVPEAELVAHYQAADAFLLPTRDLECFGLPVIEAMACGTTPLVMPEGGPAEVCRPFPDCIAAENSDEAFVELVERYLSGRISVRGEALAAHARERYSEEAVRPAILDLVQHVVGSQA